DFMMMSEIMDYQVFKLNDAVVFAAQVRRELNESEKQRIVKSMHDVFRAELPVKLMLQLLPIQPITWKNQELYLVEINFSESMSLEDIQNLVKTEHG
ncbi:MAG: hypothetical protein RL038_628, partial [Actinomycetota bacterium]